MIDNTCPLSSASGGFGQENRQTKNNVYICPGHVYRSGARPPLREAIMPCSCSLLSSWGLVSATGGQHHSGMPLESS